MWLLPEAGTIKWDDTGEPLGVGLPNTPVLLLEMSFNQATNNMYSEIASMVVISETLNKVGHSPGEALPFLLTTVNSTSRPLSCFSDQVKLA